VPKSAQNHIDSDFSLKVVILALDDMTDVVIEHKFFGHKEQAKVKPFKPFEGVNYDMFSHINIVLPERLGFTARRGKRKNLV
jgi:hypothetical protein